MEQKAFIRLFGPVSISLSHQTHILTGSIAKLITLLALQEKTAFSLQRSRLAGYIWPETTEEKARHLLSNTIYRLKNLLGDDACILANTSESVGLVGIETDVIQFKALIASAHAEDWHKAFELYQGDLAEDIDSDWVLSHRAELWEQQIYGLEQVCNLLWESADYESGHLIAKKWVTHDPINEEAYYYLMRFLVKIGRQTAALQQYQKLEKILKEELDIPPLPHLQKFYTDLMAERTDSSPLIPIPREMYIGRKIERQQLLGYLNDLENNNGAVLLLEGDAGMGKTRLIEEVQNSASLRSIQIAYGKGEDAAAPELLAPLATALRQNYRPEWMAGEKFPSFSKRLLEPFLTNSDQLRGGVVPDNLNRSVPFDTALRHLLESICQHGPMVLALDDLHWGEASLWPVLKTVCQVASHQPLFVVLSYRPIEMAENEIGRKTLLALEKEFLPARIQLSGLTLSDILQFSIELQSHLPTEKVEEIYRLSQGNPFIAKEFLLNEGEPSESLNDLLEARFRVLSPLGQQNLKAAVVLGNSFAYDVWQECSGGKIALQELIAGRFVSPNDTVNGYSFYHDFVRSMLYHDMTEEERVERHLVATNVLIRAKVSAEQIAWHCEAAEQLHEAVYYHQKAAENNLLVDGYQNARRHVQAAQRLGEQIELSAEAALRLDLLGIKISQISLQSTGELERLVDLEKIAYQLEDSNSIIQIAQLTLHMVINQGDPLAVDPACERLLEVAEKYGDKRELIEALLLVADTKMNTLMKSQEGLELIHSAIPLIESLGQNEQFLAAAKLLEANAFLRYRQTEQARECLGIVHQLLQSHKLLEPMMIRYEYLSTVLAQVESRLEEAFERYKASVPVYKMLDDVQGIMGSLGNVAHIGMVLGQHEEAISASEELMHIAQGKSDIHDRRLATIRYADSCMMGGYLDEAEKAMAEIIPWLESGATGRTARFGWHAYGGLRFYQKRYEESFLAYQRLINNVKDKREITRTPFLVYAETAKILGRDDIAHEVLENMEEQFEGMGLRQKSSTDMYHYYVFWVVRGDFDYLLRARETSFLMIKDIVNEKIRRDYIERDPLYPDLCRAWYQETRPIEIELPSSNSDEMKCVELTFDYGEHDQKLLDELGKVGLRQERIKRLLIEAAHRRVTLSNAKISELLDVNVRTIERDMQSIKEPV